MANAENEESIAQMRATQIQLADLLRFITDYALENYSTRSLLPIWLKYEMLYAHFLRANCQAGTVKNRIIHLERYHRSAANTIMLKKCPMNEMDMYGHLKKAEKIIGKK